MRINSGAINSQSINDISVSVTTATLTATLPGFEILAYGESTAASIVATLPGFDVAMYGGGYIAAELPGFSVAIQGTQYVDGSIIATLPGLDFSATGLTGSVGSVTATLQGFTLAAYGGATLQATLPGLSVAINGTTLSSGILAATLPSFTVSATGTTKATGVIVAELPSLSVLNADLVAELPGFTIAMDGRTGEANLVAYVFNIRNAETTTYTNYDFKFIIRIGHEYYGVKDDGLYQLTGTDDDGVDIDARFRIAQNDFGTTNFKRVPYCYLDSDNATTITTIVEGVSQGTYPSSFAGRRTHLARGPKGRFWQVEVANVAGNAMKVGSLELLAEVLERKV